MSDSEATLCSEDSDVYDPRGFKEISEEIECYKKNPETSSMFVSGWDDVDQDVELVEDPKANPIDHVLWAAEYGEIEILKELLNKEPGLIHAQDSDGYTPLHRASYSNHLAAVSYLLGMGAKVTTKTQLGWTALHSACKWNNHIIAARLLAAGSDPAAQSNGEQTPLHLTTSISHCKSTLLVLLLREDIVEIVKKPNNSGETPEALAYRNGIYGPLFEMVLPAISFIRSLSFTCNPYVRI